MVMDIRERTGVGAIITEAWKKWEGQMINGEFLLRHYLGGCDDSAVFLTKGGTRESEKAAIKLIPADSRSAQIQLSRWAQAANLSHPHLIRLFQMGRCRLGGMELLYVVMEYADENLSQVLPFRPLTPAEARDMLEPVLDALAYLHGRGFAHGRMKPANIMAVADQLKISSDSLCPIGEWCGDARKPRVYDPPEIASAGNSPAGDIWSLGMTLVETLTQCVAVWDGTEQADPVLPQTLPAPFVDIAHHCLRRDPQRRWTVADVAMRLQATPPAPAPQIQTTARPQTTARHQEGFADRPQKASPKSRYILLTVVVGLALAALLVGPRLLNRGSEAPRTPAVAVEHAPAQPKVQPVPEPNREPTRTGDSAPRTSDKKQVPSDAASMPPPLPEARAKTPAGDRVQGEVVNQVLPDVSQKSRDTIQGTVRVSVRVHVDPSGNVVGADIDSPGPSKFFADRALQAAQRWEFQPPTVDGRDVASEWILRFEFTSTATNVVPVQAAP
ncbi:MAG: TonB family protein [Candidatus Acidiferrales bacterium]